MCFKDNEMIINQKTVNDIDKINNITKNSFNNYLFKINSINKDELKEKFNINKRNNTGKNSKIKIK